MFKFLKIPLLFCLALGLAGPIWGADLEGRVVKVLDGDSLSLKVGQELIEVRLFGIDAPEHGQPWSNQARLNLTKLAHNKQVRARVMNWDQYGRAVCEVTLPGGVNAGYEQVKAGLAWWYRQYASDDLTLARLEAKARAAGIGLWRDPHPLPPWQYRHKSKE